jgi:pentatricopeptide repeat protein
MPLLLALPPLFSPVRRPDISFNNDVTREQQSLLWAPMPTYHDEATATMNGISPFKHFSLLLLLVLPVRHGLVQTFTPVASLKRFFAQDRPTSTEASPKHNGANLSASGKVRQDYKAAVKWKKDINKRKVLSELGIESRNTTKTQANEDKFAIRLAEMHERNSKGENLTQAYCDSVLGLCVASDEWESVLEVMEIMKSHGLSQERSTYRACLQSCFEAGNEVAARDILDAMKKAQVNPDPIDISLVVATMCKNEGNWRRALTLLRGAPQDLEKGETVPVEAYEAVLSCMVKSGGWKEAFALLNLMEQGFSSQHVPLHPLPTVSTYRLVIETCVHASAAEQAFQALQSMMKRGLKVRFALL